MCGLVSASSQVKQIWYIQFTEINCVCFNTNFFFSFPLFQIFHFHLCFKFMFKILTAAYSDIPHYNDRRIIKRFMTICSDLWPYAAAICFPMLWNLSRFFYSLFGYFIYTYHFNLRLLKYLPPYIVRDPIKVIAVFTICGV